MKRPEEVPRINRIIMIEILSKLGCTTLIEKIKKDNEVIIDTVDSYLKQIKRYEKQYRDIDFLNGKSLYEDTVEELLDKK